MVTTGQVLTATQGTNIAGIVGALINDRSIGAAVKKQGDIEIKEFMTEETYLGICKRSLGYCFDWVFVPNRQLIINLLTEEKIKIEGLN